MVILFNMFIIKLIPTFGVRKGFFHQTMLAGMEHFAFLIRIEQVLIQSPTH